MEVEFSAGTRGPIFSITFRNDARHTIYVAQQRPCTGRRGAFEAGERVVVRFGFPNWLGASSYAPDAGRSGAGARRCRLDPGARRRDPDRGGPALERAASRTSHMTSR